MKPRPPKKPWRRPEPAVQRSGPEHRHRGEVVSGRNALEEVFRSGRRTVYEVFALEESAPRWRDTPWHQALRVVDRRELDRIAGTREHQGVAARVSDYPYAALEDLFGLDVVLVLDSVEDPQNLGAAIRAAHALAGAGVVIPRHRACPVTPAVVRASAGASEHTRIARVTNLRQALEALRDEGFWLVGLDATLGADIRTLPSFGKAAIVVGGEDRGIRPVIAHGLDALARIPMQGAFNSLNVSQAASIALFELAARKGVT